MDLPRGPSGNPGFAWGIIWSVSLRQALPALGLMVGIKVTPMGGQSLSVQHLPPPCDRRGRR